MGGLFNYSHESAQKTFAYIYRQIQKNCINKSRDVFYIIIIADLRKLSGMQMSILQFALFSYRFFCGTRLRDCTTFIPYNDSKSFAVNIGGNYVIIFEKAENVSEWNKYKTCCIRTSFHNRFAEKRDDFLPDISRDIFLGMFTVLGDKLNDHTLHILHERESPFPNIWTLQFDVNSSFPVRFFEREDEILSYMSEIYTREIMFQDANAKEDSIQEVLLYLQHVVDPEEDNSSVCLIPSYEISPL